MHLYFFQYYVEGLALAESLDYSGINKSDVTSV